jgi:hypothetical protein
MEMKLPGCVFGDYVAYNLALAPPRAPRKSSEGGFDG